MVGWQIKMELLLGFRQRSIESEQAAEAADFR